MTDIKKIIIVNAHWNNRGDEAALMAVVKGLKERYHGCHIQIIIKDGKSVEQFPEIPDVTSFAAKFNAKIWDIWLSTLSFGYFGFNKYLKKTVKSIKNSDLIVYSPGGSVINERFWWVKQMEYLTPFMCAKFYRIPMVVAAPSMGPFDLGKSNRITKWLLKTPKVLVVREEISRKYLEDISITGNVHVTIDSAFYDQVDPSDNEQKLKQYIDLSEFLKSYPKVVGITITDFSWHVKYNKDKELSSRITDSFEKFITDLKSKNFGVVFIPQLFGNQNDYEYMNKFSAENTFTMRDKLDAHFQQYIISKLHMVVGMRYHSNIFAAKMGTPFIAVVYEEKMEGFLKLANLLDYSLPLSNISASMILEKFSLLDNNYNQIKAQLRSGGENWRKKAVKTMELISKYK